MNETELEDNMETKEIKPFEILTTIDNIKMESSEVHDFVIDDNVKIEEEINVSDYVKIEFNDKPLFCDHCHEYYQDYCTKCEMLVHILNRNVLNDIHNRAIEEIPKDILEIRDSFGRFGIFALKVIPEGVKFGPFAGLCTSEYPWKLNRGKFIVSVDKSKLLNWMQYINPASNSFQQNLFPFQFENNLYYHSNRKIQEGEELLVYFGQVYEDGLNEDVVMDFIPTIEENTKDVFACTFCCLGFSSRAYLTKHKSICPNEINGKFSIKVLINLLLTINNKKSITMKALIKGRSWSQCFHPAMGDVRLWDSLK